MREILFRGLRSDGKGWVEGSLLIPTTDNKTTRIFAWNGIRFEVHPETVGQFTGLLDKNGKKIFEGDVLTLSYDGESFDCEVTFHDGAFLVESDNAFYGGDADMNLIGWLKHDDYTYIVTGNIHEK